MEFEHNRLGLRKGKNKNVLRIENAGAILICSLLVACLLLACSKKVDKLSVQSPDESVEVVFSDIDGDLKYQLVWHGEEIIGPSKLSIFPDAVANIVSTESMSKDTIWHPVWGQQSSIRDHFNELQLEIDYGGVAAKLLARVYRQGVAFRFVLGQAEKEMEAVFECNYDVPKGSNYYTPAGENEPLGPVDFAGLNDYVQKESQRANKINIPLLVEVSDQSYIALLESDLYAAHHIEPMVLEVGTSDEIIKSVNKVTLDKNEWMSPWRVFLLEESLGDLVVNTVQINLATPCKIENREWIKPGKTMWDWRVHGYTAPDGFTYGVNTESYLRFIDFAAEQGIEYFLIDDAWYKQATKGTLSSRIN